MHPFLRFLSFLLFTLAVFGLSGCCHWWHHRHMCYSPPVTGEQPISLRPGSLR
jgi:hypothetical protein